MLSGTITCNLCGHMDNVLERFNKHAPCAPIHPTVWMMIESSGHRVSNDVDAVMAKAAELFAERPKADNLRVHHGECVLGLTLPGSCDCYPKTIFRSQVATAIRPRPVIGDESQNGKASALSVGRWDSGASSDPEFS